MKVLVTSRSFGKINDVPKKILEDAGWEMVNRGTNFDMAEFEQIMPTFDALIIGAHDFPSELMKKCKNLKLICKHGAGLDNIPLDTCRALGIPVCNTPNTNSNAVADLAVGLMLNATRNLARSDRAVRAGQWKIFMGHDLCNMTVGLFGFGNIAKNVARRLKGFDCKVLAYDPFLKDVPAEFADYVTLTDKEAVVTGSDLISMHLPLTDETRNMIAAPEMAAMKQGAYLVNTSRGGTVNENDLYDALKSGHLAGAAIDVVEHEPCTPDSPLLTLDNFMITPHMGMYSEEAVGAVSLICAKNVAALSKGEPLLNRVV
ncbi:MAG: phosphoglycerate dehydrogenase [Oscillospiraceae bacterium]|nr:phosphoglycerate dehydrogenase [Oscillospiraceae bacterium]